MKRKILYLGCLLTVLGINIFYVEYQVFIMLMLIIAVLMIGVITFIISFAGVYLGKKFGSLLSNKAEILGGIVLIGIGTKILIEHLFFM